MQQMSLQKPGLNVRPASTACMGHVQHTDVQACQVHQQYSDVASKAQDISTVPRAATALLQGAQAAGRTSSNLSTPPPPASLWDYNHEWALEVAALPPPDVTEMAAINVELLAMEAVLADLQQGLQNVGCDVSHVDEQLTMGSPVAGCQAAFQEMHINV